MTKPKEYIVNPQATEQMFLDNKFQSKSEFYSLRESLYENYTIKLILLIAKDDYFMITNVVDDGGSTYAPFYNTELKNKNLVAEEVIDNYNKIMDRLVKRGLLKPVKVNPKSSNKEKTNEYTRKN